MSSRWLNNSHDVAKMQVLCLQKLAKIYIVCIERRTLVTTKKTMTLNLTEAEMAALEGLCEEKDLSKTAVIRQALRLYQLVNARIKGGEKLFFEDEIAKEKKEVVVL
jgi:hypothetical protein